MEVTKFNGKLEKFNVMQDSDCEYVLIGKRQHNGDWPWYAVIRLQYLNQYIPANELTEEYSVDVLAVSPCAAGKDNCDDALDCAGFPDNYKVTEENLVEALVNYGTYAVLWSKCGNNKKGLLKKAKENATAAMSVCFGFMMDRQQNRVGATGWDWIAGSVMPRQEMQEV